VNIALPKGCELAYDGPPHTPEWYAARRTGISATDLPKILGLKPKYGQAYTVWADKLGHTAEDAAGKAARLGSWLEDPVAQLWLEDEAPAGTGMGDRERMLRRKKDPWMLATVDRMLLVPGVDLSFLEVKTRSAWSRDQWVEQDEDRPQDLPDDVMAQVQWGLAVTGLRVAYVALAITGAGLFSYPVHRDQDVIDHLITEASLVWRHVQDGTAPDSADWGPNEEALRTGISGPREGDVDLDLLPDGAKHSETWDTATLHKANADWETTQHKLHRAVLAKALGGNRRGLIGGRVAISASENGRITFRPRKDTA